MSYCEMPWGIFLLILLLSGKQLFTLILFGCSVFYSNIY